MGERVGHRNETRPERPQRLDDRGSRRARVEESRGTHERRGAGTPWWIWLLGLAALGLIAFMLFQGLDGDSSTESGTGVTTRDATAGDSSAAGSALEAGTVTASDGIDLLDVSTDSSALARYEGTAVEGTTAPVESVVGDETFWIGPSPEQRLFVFLNLEGESGPDIDTGDDVTFDGTMKALPVDYQERFDLSSDEGAEQLQGQARYIEVTQIDEG